MQDNYYGEPSRWRFPTFYEHYFMLYEYHNEPYNKMSSISYSGDNSRIMHQTDDDGQEHIYILCGDTIHGELPESNRKQMIIDYMNRGDVVGVAIENDNTVYLAFYRDIEYIKPRRKSMKRQLRAVKQYDNLSMVSVGDYVSMEYDEYEEKYVVYRGDYEIGHLGEDVIKKVQEQAFITSILSRPKPPFGQIIEVDDDFDNPKCRIEIYY